jgi:hypothetical protein
MAPTLEAGASALPPEGAFAPWGGPAALNYDKLLHARRTM